MPLRLLDQYPFETDKIWTLEVVEHQNDSQVWDNQFQPDAEARDGALAALNSEDAIAIMRGNDVVPFSATLTPRWPQKAACP